MEIPIPVNKETDEELKKMNYGRKSSLLGAFKSYNKKTADSLNAVDDSFNVIIIKINLRISKLN